MRTALLVLGLALAAGPARAADNLLSATIVDQQEAMSKETATASDLVAAYLNRIHTLNHQGPRLNAVIALDPTAVADARIRDAERRSGRIGPLQGVSILIKDNIDVAGVPTTAGSLALIANVPSRDAPVVSRLKAAGAVILGKTNLSEWANYRSRHSVAGWSAVGGLTRNPYALDRLACGSSAGSAAGVAAGFAAAAVGTETSGSVICPASNNGLVGMKPTLGLVSRTGVVPITPEQDTPGPIARTVTDAAILLSAMAGSDPADPATREADAHRMDYAAALDAGSRKGARLGVLRQNQGRSAGADAVFAAALRRLQAGGAVLVEVAMPDEKEEGDAGRLATQAEFKIAIASYLAKAPSAVKVRNLADIVAFNRAEPRETALFGQDIMIDTLNAPDLSDADRRTYREKARQLAGPEGIDRLLTQNNLVALVAMTNGPSTLADPVNGGGGFGTPSGLPAAAGYPHLTVPAGQVSGLPIGVSFMGTAWSEAKLLSLGYAFEKTTGTLPGPSFTTTLARPEFASAVDPPT